MKKFVYLVSIICLFTFSAVSNAAEKFIVKKSGYSVTETLDRLEAVIKKKGITLFARVDHAKGAGKVGLNMSDTQLLIFGNPKMGTPLMNENILMGLDLPMKALAYKDDKGQVWLAYLNPAELQSRHKIKNQKIINKMIGALNGLTNAALK